MNESELVKIFDEISPRMEPDILRSFVKILCHYEEKLIEENKVILPPPELRYNVTGNHLQDSFWNLDRLHLKGLETH